MTQIRLYLHLMHLYQDDTTQHVSFTCLIITFVRGLFVYVIIRFPVYIVEDSIGLEIIVANDA